MSACAYINFQVVPITIPSFGLPLPPISIGVIVPVIDLSLPAPPGFNVTPISAPIPGFTFPKGFGITPPVIDVTLPIPPGFNVVPIAVPIPGFTIPKGFGIIKPFCVLD